jgi:phosphate ABC transporter phosphate-binding protein
VSPIRTQSDVTGTGNAARRTRRFVVRARRLFAIGGALTLAALVSAGPAQAASYTPISGAGSTWSSNALQQWASNVSQFGMTIQFQANGSTQGRQLFYNNTVDFAVSEIPYGVKDQGVADPKPNRGFAYMPIVAGGTSFMYNLKIGTHRVTNLRLSGDTIVKIFTGQITKWDDAAIKADNPALTLPARKIIPVVRSDGSGTTAQLTTWMSKLYSSQWDAYCRKAGRSTPCGVTSFYPIVNGSGFTAQNGSVGVAGYTASDTSEGAITYVEYSYAQNARFPVAKLLNAAGYYTLPTAQAVAVALLKAQINETVSSQDYLTQILDGVYANADKRTYPLSSYSYMIIPTDLTAPMTAAKGFTLGDFAYYFLCEGQQQAPDLGYSPLPINLVQAGLKQVARIPGVNIQNKDIKGCNNPTFSPDGSNKLAQTAPNPPACDKQGSTQCADSTGFGGGASGSGSGATGGASSAAAASGKAGVGATGAAGGPAGSAAQNAAAGTGSAADGSGTGSGDIGSGNAQALPVSLSSDYAGGSSRTALMVLAALFLVAVTVGPPLIARSLGRSKHR